MRGEVQKGVIGEKKGEVGIEGGYRSWGWKRSPGTIVASIY